MGKRRSSTIRDARMVRTDQALRDALLALVEREPLERITVRRICAEAGIHYATFFRHHVSKEALLEHVARDQIDRLVELSLPAQKSAQDSAGFLVLCAYVSEHRRLWTALLTGGAGGAMREELLSHAQGVAAKRGAANSWLPVDLATTCTVSLIVETIAWWLRQPPKRYTEESVAALLHRLLCTSTLVGDEAAAKPRPRGGGKRRS
jgi:AcrR family transcriptional regulator